MDPLEFKKWLLSCGMYIPLSSLFESQEVSGLEVKNVKAFMGAEMKEILLFTADVHIKEEAYQRLSSQSFTDNRFPSTEMRDHTHSYRILKGEYPIVFYCRPIYPRKPTIMVLERDLPDLFNMDDFI